MVNIQNDKLHLALPMFGGERCVFVCVCPWYSLHSQQTILGSGNVSFWFPERSLLVPQESFLKGILHRVFILNYVIPLIKTS